MKPLFIYLDQNHWIHLSQEYHQRNKSTNASYQNLIRKISLAVKQNKAIFPISIFHAVETFLANDPSKQERLLDFAAEVSQGWVIAPPWNVVPFELDILASGTRKKRVNVFEKLDSPERLYDFLFSANQYREANIKYKERTKDFAQRIGRARIRKDGKPYSRKALRYLYARNLFSDIKEELFELSAKHEIGADKLVTLLGLFENVPVLDVQLTLTTERDRNLNKPVSTNDMVDLSHLCVAIPYCDIVIPDNFWASLAKIKRLGLEGKYQTKILESLSLLENQL